MKGLLIAAVDVLTLILILMLLGLFAISYGSKGSGEKSWISIESNLPNDTEFLHNPPENTTYAILIKGDTIELLPFVGRKIKEEGKLVFKSPQDLLRNLNIKQRYVIYEVDRKGALGDIIRLMVKAGVSNISVAQVGE